MLGVAHLWTRHQGARWQIAPERGLRPVAAGMIVATAYVLFMALDGCWPARGIALCATATLLLTRVNALVVLAIGAALYALLSLVVLG